MPKRYWREIKAWSCRQDYTTELHGQSSLNCHQHLPVPISLWLLEHTLSLPQTEAQVKRKLYTDI